MGGKFTLMGKKRKRVGDGREGKEGGKGGVEGEILRHSCWRIDALLQIRISSWETAKLSF